MLLIFLIAGCGTTEKASRDTDEGPAANDETVEGTAGVSPELMIAMNSTRSKLNDVYSTLERDIPNFFLKESSARDIGDPYEGYRIQILSTQSVAKADSLANDFSMWARDNFISYIPKSYVFFRQPHYKVHVGNFQFHDHAMKLNQIIKERYPDAWVVPDEVEPGLVPADTSDVQMSQ